MMGSLSPTQRTLKALRAKGYTCAIVERWNAYAKIRQDLFGFIDIIALDPTRGVVGVQSTGTAFAQHDRKLTQERRDICLTWITTPGAHIELWGWRKVKVKRGGLAMRYEPRVKVYTVADFCDDEF